LVEGSNLAEIIDPKSTFESLRKEYISRIKLNKELNADEKDFCIGYLGTSLKEKIKHIRPELINEIEEEIKNSYGKMSTQEYESFIQKHKDKLNPQEIDLCIEHHKRHKETINKNYCPRCCQIWSNGNYCTGCLALHVANNQNKSGNEFIDNLLFRCRLEQCSMFQGSVIEWVSYENFDNVECKTEGKFGSIYFATWLEGCIVDWNQDHGFIRNGPKKVVLKLLKNSNNLDKKFFEEAMTHVQFSSQGSRGVQCYGLTKFPETRELMLIMDRMENGCLGVLLEHNDVLLTWKEIFFLLKEIFYQLSQIHDNGMIHKDLHPGNILSGTKGWFIGDFGFSGPANKNPDDQIFGIMPYIAPEVLYYRKHSPESDIYSMGIIMWQLVARRRPFSDRKYDIHLARAICDGLRPPEITNIPDDYQGIMKRCWDAGPSTRPKAQEMFHYFDKILQKMSCGEYMIPEMKIDFNSLYTHGSDRATSTILTVDNLPIPKNKVQYKETTDGLLLEMPYSQRVDDLKTSQIENEEELSEFVLRSRAKIYWELSDNLQDPYTS
ncbi:4276_t:CDS:2, partial [Racocetra fulgida]